MARWLLGLLISVLLVCASEAAHKHFNGVAHVNSKAFDKIIPRFKAALVKFDLVHNMGQTQKAFKEVADWSVDDDDMIVVEVCVEYKGINHDLMDRFQLKKRELPQYMLFVRGREKPLYYMGDILRSQDIISFIKVKTKVWFDYPTYMEKFDKMVESFFESKPGDRKKIVDDAQSAAAVLTDDVMKERSLVYVDVMREYLEHGEKRLNEIHDRSHFNLDNGEYRDFLEKQRMEGVSRIMDVFMDRKKKVLLRKRAEEL